MTKSNNLRPLAWISSSNFVMVAIKCIWGECSGVVQRKVIYTNNGKVTLGTNSAAIFVFGHQGKFSQFTAQCPIFQKGLSFHFDRDDNIILYISRVSAENRARHCCSLVLIHKIIPLCDFYIEEFLFVENPDV